MLVSSIVQCGVINCLLYFKVLTEQTNPYEWEEFGTFKYNLYDHGK